MRRVNGVLRAHAPVHAQHHRGHDGEHEDGAERAHDRRARTPARCRARTARWAGSRRCSSCTGWGPRNVSAMRSWGRKKSASTRPPSRRTSRRSVRLGQPARREAEHEVDEEHLDQPARRAAQRVDARVRGLGQRGQEPEAAGRHQQEAETLARPARPGVQPDRDRRADDQRARERGQPWLAGRAGVAERGRDRSRGGARQGQCEQRPVAQFAARRDRDGGVHAPDTSRPTVRWRTTWLRRAPLPSALRTRPGRSRRCRAAPWPSRSGRSARRCRRSRARTSRKTPGSRGSPRRGARPSSRPA